MRKTNAAGRKKKAKSSHSASNAGSKSVRHQMKYKTALKQSIVSVKFLLLVITVMVPLTIRHPSRYTVVPLVIFALFLLLDVATIRSLRRGAAKDPSLLERRIP